MAALIRVWPPLRALTARGASHRLLRDSLLVTLGGQVERLLGTLTALALRWGLDPAHLGVYSGLRIYLDQTNRSSLGIGLGAVQEIPILRAAGRHDEARHLADVACTANTITCTLYALGLLAWAGCRGPALTGDPLAREWTWGLVIIAFLTLLQRRLSFHVAILRAHQEFALTTELDLVEALASALLVGAGLWLGRFWGLLMAVGLLLAFKLFYLHIRHPLRFSWRWDGRLIGRLMVIGLPIFANTAVYGFLVSLDRVLILWLVPDGERAAGLYSIAIMGTSWSVDLAGRIVTVLYPHFQTTLGRTRDPVAVGQAAAEATVAQAPLLAGGSAVACVVGPVVLGLLMPRYTAGLPALRPLLPGMLLLALTWPARQMLITLERPYRLFATTGVGLVVSLVFGAIGAKWWGIVGVAWGMSLGLSTTYLLTSLAAFVPLLGWSGWWRHQARLAGVLTGITAGTVMTLKLPLESVFGGRSDLAPALVRLVVLAAWLIPGLLLWLAQRSVREEAPCST